jgi:3',5'-nucleoside bisphosphate phosphatase
MKREDFHLHTTVSDGEQSPLQLLELAGRLGMARIAITDHDALDAHRLIASRSVGGPEIIAGIEIDCSYIGKNIEILGYHIDIDNGPLNDYLSMIQGQRKRRALNYIQRLNEHFGSDVLHVEEVIPQGRITILKPHILRPMIGKKLFASYEEAKKFIATIPDDGFSRATATEAIRLIQGAGGKAVLAHPGVYRLSFDVIRSMIIALKEAGIDGVETYYPYHDRMADDFKDPAAEEEFISKIESLAESFKLLRTRGTDSHSEKDFVRLNSP